MANQHLEEQNMTKCKVCGELKLRIQDGLFNHKDKRWRGEDGLMWNGRTCSQCHKDKQKNLNREKRLK